MVYVISFPVLVVSVVVLVLQLSSVHDELCAAATILDVNEKTSTIDEALYYNNGYYENEEEDDSHHQYQACEVEILLHMSEERPEATGAKAYISKESEIQFCPNQCSNITRVHEYCSSQITNNADFDESHDTFITPLDGQVKVHSERCCDEKKCSCVCQFECETFKSMRVKFENAGYTQCFSSSDEEIEVDDQNDELQPDDGLLVGYGTDLKSKGLLKARKMCQVREMQMKCELEFQCPTQYVCYSRQCLMCIKPTCFQTHKNALISKLLIEKKNESEQEIVKESNNGDGDMVDTKNLDSNEILSKWFYIKQQQGKDNRNDNFDFGIQPY